MTTKEKLDKLIVKLLKQGMTDDQVVAKCEKDILKPPVGVVRRVRTELLAAKTKGVLPTGVTKVSAESPVVVDEYLARIENERRLRKQVEDKYNKLLQERIETDDAARLVQIMAPQSYKTAASAPIKRSRGKQETSPQAAVLLLGDTHIGKVVDPDQTQNWGNYDIGVFLDRLQLLQDSVLSILVDHVDCEIPELHILMLGDMVDGGLNHGNEADQRYPIGKQTLIGSHALSQFVRNLKPHFPRLVVTPVCGNHGRWPGQKRVPTKNKNSNADGMMYQTMEALLKDIDGLTFDFNDQPSRLVNINGSSFMVTHGDHLRGGDRALGIPSHAIARQVSNLAQQMALREQRPPNYYCFGHFHRDMTIPHINGKIFVNGAFPGLDEYTMSANYPEAPPEQKLLLVHPRHRVTANWPIYLGHAEPNSSRFDMEGIWNGK